MISKMRKWSKLAVIVTLIVLAAAGTGTYVLLFRSPSKVSAQGSIAASCASSITSLSVLANGASDVVVGKVLPLRKVVKVGGIPFTLTSIRTEKVIKGTSVTKGAVISLRQLGPGRGDAQPIVQNGHTFLLFLSPFAWSPGKAVPGEYVDQACGHGLYEESSTSKGTFVAMDSSIGHLPTTLKLSEVTSAISS